MCLLIKKSDNLGLFVHIRKNTYAHQRICYFLFTLDSLWLQNKKCLHFHMCVYDCIYLQDVLIVYNTSQSFHKLGILF